MFLLVRKRPRPTDLRFLSGGCLYGPMGRTIPRLVTQALLALCISALPCCGQSSVSDADIRAAIGKLKQEKGLIAFANHYVTTEYPVFVPAKNRVWISLIIPYPYPVKEKDKPNLEERKQFTTEVAKYLTNEMGNLDGFVLFDTANRYEIDFPNGWAERAKQT